MSFFKTIKTKIESIQHNTSPNSSSTNLLTSYGNNNNSNNNNSNINNSNHHTFGGNLSTTTTIFNNDIKNEKKEQEEEQTILIEQDEEEWNENDKYVIHIWGNGMKKENYPIILGLDTLGLQERIVSISTGAIHVAFITSLGRLFTFGDGLLGKLGHGDQQSYTQPKLVEFFNGEKIVIVSTGGKHTIALTDTNKLYSWGGNDSCQLGNGSSQSYQPLPQRITFNANSSSRDSLYGNSNHMNLKIVKLSCSTTRSAFVTSNGLLFTWGRGDHGRLGHGDTLMQSTPKQVLGLYGHFVRDISSGGGHSMILTSKGEVFSWGRGENGQLGYGTIITQQLTPKQVMALQGKVIKLISAGGYHSLAIQDNGDVYAWGRTDYGVLGIGTLEVGDKTSPYLLQTIKNLDENPIIQVSSGFQHNISIRQDRSLLTWGCGAGGRLTNTKSEDNQFIPKKPIIDFKPTLISCGEVITMIVGKIHEEKPIGIIKSPQNITQSPLPITITTTIDNNINNNPNNNPIKNSIELPILKSLVDNNNPVSTLKRSASPTPSFVSLASDKLSPGKDLLINSQTYFLEWLSRISKSKEILNLIQSKITNTKDDKQIEQQTEKNINQYDELNRKLKSLLSNFILKSNNTLEFTQSQNDEIESILKSRNSLAKVLLDNDIDKSIEYWSLLHNKKETTFNKLAVLIKANNNNNSNNNNSSSNNNINLNTDDIQKQSLYLMEKLNQSLNLFYKNIDDSVNNGQMESLRLSMEELQFIMMETFKYAEKYSYVLENTLTQSQSLISLRKGKKIEIQLHIEKFKEATELMDQREKLKSSYRTCKRNSIELSKQIEVLELDDDDEDNSSYNSNDEKQLENLKDNLLKLKKEEQKLIIQQQNINNSLQDIIDKYVPELKVTMKQQDKISNKVKDTGLLVLERKFSNYDIIKTLSTHPHNVYLASLDDQLVVLKEFGIGDQMGKQMFERQVSLMKQMNHICIMPIQAVFYDRNAFLQMEYVDGGDLVQWLKTQERKPWEIQKMFQQIIQGIAYMHSNNIIHRDLKLENILIKDSTIPIISDFDLSKDLNHSVQSNVTLFQGGTEYYKAPEMKELGDKGNYATDIWAFGVMLYKSHFPKGREPFLLPEEQSLPIPSSHSDQRLVSLLQSILQRNPSLRPTSHQITVHPYFVTSLVEDLLQSRTLIDSREKIAAIRAHISSILEISEDINDSSLELTVERENIVRDCFQFFKKVETSKLFQRLEVTFKGEKGLDHGGLTSEMYSILLNTATVKLHDNNNNNNISSSEELKSIFSKKFNLFERSLESPFYLLQSASLECNSPDYPLSSLQREQNIYKTLGKIFLKSVIDGRVIPDVFPPSFFKYLLNIKPNLQDLEVYDPQLAMSFKKVLVLDNIDEYLSITFESLVEGGELIPVNDSNKVDFIQKNIERVLIGCRQSQMEAFKSGFMSIDSLNAHFQLFSSTELQLLMCGNTLVDSNLLKRSLKFIGFPDSSQTPSHFSKVLDEMSQDELHLFLRFLTGMVAIPLQGLEKPLSIVYTPKSDKLPVSHTCSYQLDLPDYNDFDLLKKKILQMIEWLDSGFSFI